MHQHAVRRRRGKQALRVRFTLGEIQRADIDTDKELLAYAGPVQLQRRIDTGKLHLIRHLDAGYFASDNR